MFIVNPFIKCNDLAIVAEANLRCGDFFVRKKSSQIGNFLVVNYQIFFGNTKLLMSFKKQTLTMVNLTCRRRK